MNVSTQRCVVCHKQAVLEVPEDGYRRWKSGVDILQALPGAGCGPA
jgi:cytochrome c5